MHAKFCMQKNEFNAAFDLHCNKFINIDSFSPKMTLMKWKKFCPVWQKNETCNLFHYQITAETSNIPISTKDCVYFLNMNELF